MTRGAGTDRADGSDDSTKSRFRRGAYGLALVDAAVYAVVVTLVALCVAGLLNVVFIRGSWLGVELALFFLGWILLAYGTVLSWPASPWSVDRSEGTVEIDRQRDDAWRSSFQARRSGLNRLVARLLPFDRLEERDRYGVGPKVLAGAVLTLFVSYLIETIVVTNL